MEGYIYTIYTSCLGIQKDEPEVISACLCFHFTDQRMTTETEEKDLREKEKK